MTIINVPNKAQIAEMRSANQQGETQQSIADKLNAGGFTTPEGGRVMAYTVSYWVNEARIKRRYKRQAEARAQGQPVPRAYTRRPRAANTEARAEATTTTGTDTLFLEVLTSPHYTDSKKVRVLIALIGGA